MIYYMLLRIKIREETWVTLGEEHCFLWEIRDLIAASSGWVVFNQQSVIPANSLISTLEKGIWELTQRCNSYHSYEVLHGLGTIFDTLTFYRELLQDCKEYPFAELYGNVVF